ncbi:MAG: hypothetical protein MJY59_00560 [Bacteroidaceae bacterium]|nr:hypothetical protein [Bacteroidaceae bacterium]
MKKSFRFIAMLSISIISFISCIDDDGNSADATVDFGARMDSIYLSDPADSVFICAIDTALQEMGLLSKHYSGVPSILFKEYAKVDVNSIPYAVAKAVEQANSTYKTRIDGATRDVLLRHIQVAKTPAPLPVDSLDAFSVRLSLLYAFSSPDLIVAGVFSRQF